MNWKQVRCRGKGLQHYSPALQDGYLEDLGRIVANLKGCRIVHLNATPAGGGVAEILKSLVPLKRSTSISTVWSAMPPSAEFFGVTRKMHDLFQGAPGSLESTERNIYFSHIRSVSKTLPVARWRPDAWFIHDPQLIPLIEHLPQSSRKIWVCHVDTSYPNESAIEMVRPYLHGYDRIIFSMPQYVMSGLNRECVDVCPPAIDPLRSKNALLPLKKARRRLRRFGVDPNRLLLAQIARFDLWKDPMGVIDAYRIVKAEFPEIQLALVGALTAVDDPTGAKVLRMVQKHANHDPDIHLFYDPAVINDSFVNTFQTAPDVVLQKSTREGFGLTVTEAMWKGRPVIGGNCGGITLQIENGVNGFLVSSVEECATRIIEILKDPALAGRLGQSAHASVKKNFLMPRLMRDYLRQI